jgi:hypothetical protein
MQEGRPTGNARREASRQSKHSHKREDGRRRKRGYDLRLVVMGASEYVSGIRILLGVGMWG